MLLGGRGAQNRLYKSAFEVSLSDARSGWPTRSMLDEATQIQPFHRFDKAETISSDLLLFQSHCPTKPTRSCPIDSPVVPSLPLRSLSCLPSPSPRSLLRSCPNAFPTRPHATDTALPRCSLQPGPFLRARKAPFVDTCRSTIFRVPRHSPSLATEGKAWLLQPSGVEETRSRKKLRLLGRVLG